MTIDLNCDMGELEDAAHEAALMDYVTSANIACGGHAGDDAIMERTARLALERGVRIGAHPGYPDRANQKRVQIPMAPVDIARMVREQIERLDAVVRPLGGVIVHVKPHGALYNVAVHNAGGAGVLIQIPHKFYARECAKLGFELPLSGSYGVGMTFLPVERPAQLSAKEFRIVREGDGILTVTWFSCVLLGHHGPPEYFPVSDLDGQNSASERKQALRAAARRFWQSVPALWWSSL